MGKENRFNLKRFFLNSSMFNKSPKKQDVTKGMLRFWLAPVRKNCNIGTAKIDPLQFCHCEWMTNGSIYLCLPNVGPIAKLQGINLCWLNIHYRIRRLCREHLTLGRGTIPLGSGCAERELSAQRTRHRWAGEEPFAESHVRSTRYTCAESGILLSAADIS
jgi:hypothetical protein